MIEFLEFLMRFVGWFVLVAMGGLCLYFWVLFAEWVAGNFGEYGEGRHMLVMFTVILIPFIAAMAW